MNQDLRITEIFYSLQGETRTTGLPTVFIRLTGCPLRCQYCDTAYAFKGGIKMSIEQIMAKVSSYNPRYITVTGGEPLAQKPCLDLLNQLVDKYEVSLETSGALDVSGVHNKVTKILDLKTPDSKECHRNLYENVELLNSHDQVKFVICSKEDYEWSKSIVAKYDLTNKCEVLFSPSFGQQNPRDLAEWIIEDNLKVRFQLQIHKYLWNDEPGH